MSPSQGNATAAAERFAASGRPAWGAVSEIPRPLPHKRASEAATGVRGRFCDGLERLDPHASAPIGAKYLRNSRGRGERVRPPLPTSLADECLYLTHDLARVTPS